jgi:hypothetical protein
MSCAVNAEHVDAHAHFESSCGITELADRAVEDCGATRGRASLLALVGQYSAQSPRQSRASFQTPRGHAYRPRTHVGRKGLSGKARRQNRRQHKVCHRQCAHAGANAVSGHRVIRPRTWKLLAEARAMECRGRGPPPVCAALGGSDDHRWPLRHSAQLQPLPASPPRAPITTKAQRAITRAGPDRHHHHPEAMTYAQHAHVGGCVKPTE